MQLYKIKLNNEAGYLIDNDVLCLYSRGEALKKAIAFNGRIEKHGKNYGVTDAKIAQISKSEIGDKILSKLDGRQLMEDTDINLNEGFYYGGVFQDILDEQMDLAEVLQLDSNTLDEIHVLSVIAWSYDYIQVIN